MVSGGSFISCARDDGIVNTISSVIIFSPSYNSLSLSGRYVLITHRVFRLISGVGKCKPDIIHLAFFFAPKYREDWRVFNRNKPTRTRAKRKMH